MGLSEGSIEARLWRLHPIESCPVINRRRRSGLTASPNSTRTLMLHFAVPTHDFQGGPVFFLEGPPPSWRERSAAKWLWTCRRALMRCPPSLARACITPLCPSAGQHSPLRRRAGWRAGSFVRSLAALSLPRSPRLLSIRVSGVFYLAIVWGWLLPAPSDAIPSAAAGGRCLAVFVAVGNQEMSMYTHSTFGWPGQGSAMHTGQRGFQLARYRLGPGCRLS
ncbi:hypothetical protein B0T24DRAFT_338732 [Lasiosphaeria ovina]|uniref:Uncharacterized protein n=1 Tax=Lasiosphaeria ovina TaxID=92902 RepID=A0AAE0K813_9PEZI|nr:hypothetical protein B0T24DRAFT_338732 [Lasiosphaeria ovina]